MKLVKVNSHDYPFDTQMYFDTHGRRSELILFFEHEDYDMGTERLIFAGGDGENEEELMADLHNEIKTYLDAKDSSSFYEQQGEIHSIDDYYNNFTRSALYAFEAITKPNEMPKLYLVYMITVCKGERSFNVTPCKTHEGAREVYLDAFKSMVADGYEFDNREGDETTDSFCWYDEDTERMWAECYITEENCYEDLKEKM